MNTGHRIKVRGYRFKDGKLVQTSTHKDVSARLRERGSKRVRVARGVIRHATKATRDK